MFKFQLLGGRHIQWNPDMKNFTVDQIRKHAAENGIDLDGCADRGDMLRRIGAEQVFSPGQEVLSDVDLEAKHGRDKFRRIGGGELPQELVDLKAENEELKRLLKEYHSRDATADQFDAMTVAQLKDFAAEQEIDLGAAATKREIIAELRRQAVSV